MAVAHPLMCLLLKGYRQFIPDTTTFLRSFLDISYILKHTSYCLKMAITYSYDFLSAYHAIRAHNRHKNGYLRTLSTVVCFQKRCENSLSTSPSRRGVSFLLRCTRNAQPDLDKTHYEIVIIIMFMTTHHCEKHSYSA